eukprot:jgi/Tetstr1/464439/TSEL_000110.t2
MTGAAVSAAADGPALEVLHEEIAERVRALSFGLNEDYIHADEVAGKVVAGICSDLSAKGVDGLLAETCAALTASHPDYGILAGRIAVSQLHKETKMTFSETVSDLHHYIEKRTGQPAPLISDKVYNIVMKNKQLLDSAIQTHHDFAYDYFGYKTLERSYLLRLAGRVVERPQYLLMRVAVGIHQDDMEAVLQTYTLLSERWMTHASPTLFNAGTPRPQLSSCFLICMKSDSIEGIYDTLKEAAVISKCAGGIGLSIHNIRATGAYIRGTNGTSNGILPMLRVFNDTARYVDQGGGKRKGAVAIYLEPWHGDIFSWLDLRKNHGKEEARARDLFYALWIPDLFMKRVEANGDWSLMSPDSCPGLADKWGAEFDALYTQYEREGRAMQKVKAQRLWFAILEAQVETGNPFMLFKDHCNRKSNQQNLGTIKSSNLCTEIVQFTSPEETAVCNLASLALPRFVRQKMLAEPASASSNRSGMAGGAAHPKLLGSLGAAGREFDFERLSEVTALVAANLDRVIDESYYPVETARRSNMRHRPIGIGVQGLADCFILLGLPFDSPAAAQLNRDIFETIYYAALKASCKLAAQKGRYPSYTGSPISEGRLQPDLWGVTPSSRWDWAALRADIATHGVRNSLLVAPMPTASTSQILGNNECFEPYTSNIYVRRVLSGEFTVVNQHLLADLVALGLWDPSMKNELVAAEGSVQGLVSLSPELKAIYKTVWEISQRRLVDMAADRGAFIDQSQSFNVHMVEPTFGKLTSLHFHCWRKGLKTGMYYLRTRAAADAIKFTVDQGSLSGAKRAAAGDADGSKSRKGPATVETASAGDMAALCRLDNKDECLMCGS